MPVRAAADPFPIEKLRAGDRQAFNELVRAHQRGVYYLVLRYVRNPDDAADLTQRTFLRAYHARESLYDASVRAWLFRIAINLSLNHLRDAARKPSADFTDRMASEDAVGARRIIDREEAAALREAIRRLPRQQRTVLELRVHEELPFREIAELVGCTENAAKVNFHHAVKRLRKLLVSAAGRVAGGTR